jgi:hypothetical protein
MILAVFALMLWCSVTLAQVLIMLPFKVLHVFDLPPVLGLAILFGIFAWIFGDES